MMRSRKGGDQKMVANVETMFSTREKPWLGNKSNGSTIIERSLRKSERRFLWRRNIWSVLEKDLNSFGKRAV